MKKIYTKQKGVFGPYKNPATWETESSFTPPSTRNLDTSQWGGEVNSPNRSKKSFFSKATGGRMK